MQRIDTPKGWRTAAQKVTTELYAGAQEFDVAEAARTLVAAAPAIGIAFSEPELVILRELLLRRKG